MDRAEFFTRVKEPLKDILRAYRECIDDEEKEFCILEIGICKIPRKKVYGVSFDNHREDEKKLTICVKDSMEINVEEL